MKKVVFVFGCLVFGLCFASVAMAGLAAGTGVDGSRHDLSTSFPGVPVDSLTRICIYCHTPHHAYKLSPANGGPAAGVGSGDMAPDAYNYLPLWNHAFSLNLAFDMYQNGPGAPQNPLSPKASQAIANGMAIGSSSLLCLSCHDGSQAVNTYGTSSAPGTSKSTGVSKLSGANQIGKDGYLGNHHPIGFDYDAVQAVDTEIWGADFAALGGAGKVRDHLSGPGSTLMECATCHSVHNKGNTGETLLWRSDKNSRLCLTCHDKGTYPGTTTP